MIINIYQDIIKKIKNDFYTQTFLKCLNIKILKKNIKKNLKIVI